VKVLVSEVGAITPETLCLLPKGGVEFQTLSGGRFVRAVVANADEVAVLEMFDNFFIALDEANRGRWEPEAVLRDLLWISSACADFEAGMVCRLRAIEDGFTLLPEAVPGPRIDRRQVGIVHVDSAAVLITDPAYVKHFGQDHDFSVDLNELTMREPRPDGYPYSVGGAWEGRCNTHGAGQMVHADGRAGAGIVAESGLGDGEYPVFVEYDEETGRVARVIVEFL
jgi:hypothetical protein